MDLFKLVAKIAIDKSDFDKGIEAAQKETKSLASGIASKTGSAAKALAPLSAGVMAIGTAAIKVSADFDAEMSKVQAISGATASDIAVLREKAIEMGDKTKFSLTEAAEAYEYMAMAGWKTNDMLNGIEGIMNLAAASGEDLAATSDIVTDALTAFGMSQDESAHFADILAAASSNANTNVGMMGETFKYAAAMAGTLGYSAEDTALATGLMANSGIKASQAGTSLRNIMQRLIKPTKESAMAIERLGLKIDDGQGNMYSFREIMDQMRDAFKDVKFDSTEYERTVESLNKKLEDGTITEDEYNDALEESAGTLLKSADAQKGALAAQLAGAYGLSGLLAIVSASEEDYNKLADAIDNCSDTFVRTTDGSIIPMSEALANGIDYVEEFDGAANAMADTMQQNLSGQIEILKGNIQTLAYSFMKDLMPEITSLVKKLQNAVHWFASLNDKTKKTILTIAGIVAALAPVLGIISKLATGINLVITVFGKIPAVITAAKTVFTGLWAVLSANPIGLIITAVAALAAEIIYLWNTNEDFRNFVKECWENIKDFFVSAWEGIKEAWSYVGEFFSEKWRDIKDAFSSVPEWFTEKFTNALNAIKDTWSDVKTFFWERWKDIKSAFNDAKSWFSKKFTDAYNSVKTVWAPVGAFFARKYEDIKQAFAGVREWFSNRFTEAWNAVQTAWSNVTTFFSNVYVNIQNAFNGIVEWFSNLFGNVISAIKEAFNIDWTQIGKNIMDGIKGGINGAADAVKETAVSAANTVASGIKNFFGIASPSKLMAQYGDFVMEGLGVGIERSAILPVKEALKASQKVSQSIRDAANKQMSDFSLFGGVSQVDLSDYATVGTKTASNSSGSRSSANAVLQAVNSAGKSNTPVNVTLILELDRMQTAKAVYKLNSEETARIGLKLAGGVA